LLTNAEEVLTPKKLLIRADANVAMGTGHVMRCLALAQAWQDSGGVTVFALAETTPSLDRRLREEGIEVENISASAGTAEDAEQTSGIGSQEKANWMVVDGYQFGSTYQAAIKTAGFKLLFLDDYAHTDRYYADLVLNQNVSAAANLYEKREPHTRLLLGPKYCLLRREFNRWHDWRREIVPVAHRVLVMMGGSDPGNFTERVVEALNSIDDSKLEATIVIGGSNARDNFTHRTFAGSATIDFRRDASNMAELMVDADVAVSASGTTCWEMCRLGLPALLIDLADNQTPVARELHRRGCAIHLGSPEEVSVENLAEQIQYLRNSPEDRQAISSRGRALVDDEGAKRVVSILRGISFRLRPALESDSHLLWEWANDSAVRAASFSAAPIPWETHKVWFNKKLSSKCHILIAEDEERTPFAQIRFDQRSDGDLEIGLSVAKAWRGRGYGAEIIREAARLMWNASSPVRLHAFVKPENVASVAVFEASGFKRIGSEQIQGSRAIHFVYHEN
jgi:UDP-2,4-diacetamido-2,4,6-trideoxy-beta-L-altropyranose hydrolase